MLTQYKVWVQLYQAQLYESVFFIPNSYGSIVFLTCNCFYFQIIIESYAVAYSTGTSRVSTAQFPSVVISGNTIVQYCNRMLTTIQGRYKIFSSGPGLYKLPFYSTPTSLLSLPHPYPVSITSLVSISIILSFLKNVI